MSRRATTAPPRGCTAKISALLVALGCVLAAGAGVEATDAIDLNATRSVGPGQQARINGGTVRVTQVTAGTKLDPVTGNRIHTKGLFIAVTIKLDAPGQEQSLNPDGLFSGDWKFRPVRGGPVVAPAGYRTTTRRAFEVNPDHLDDLYLQLSETETISRYKQILHVELDSRQDWRQQAQGRTVEASGTPIATTALP